MKSGVEDRLLSIGNENWDAAEICAHSIMRMSTADTRHM